MQTGIEDTYAEAFEGLYCRIILTADDAEVLRRASEAATATPSVVIGRTEGGIERWLSERETPDKRRGSILQFWGAIDQKKPLGDSVEKLEKELSYRIRQDVLVRPFTAVFDAHPKQEGRLDMMRRVGHCGDGFEWEERRYERNMIIVPIMVPDFQIERFLGYGKGVMGANFWYMCKTKKAVTTAGIKALNAIGGVEGAIAPFGICSAGSKPETRFPSIGPTTNHPYCPTLRDKIGEESMVPEGANFIPEIVINGTSLEVVKEAMKAGINSMLQVDDVIRVSAGNYRGKLGKYRIHLQELFQ